MTFQLRMVLWAILGGTIMIVGEIPFTPINAALFLLLIPCILEVARLIVLPALGNNLSYNNKIATVHKRTFANRFLIKIYASHKLDVMHHNASLNFTTVTIGAVSTTDVNYTPEHYSIHSGSRTGGYCMEYNGIGTEVNPFLPIENIFLTDEMAAIAAENPVLKRYLVGNTLKVYQYGGIPKEDCQYIRAWLANPKTPRYDEYIKVRMKAVHKCLTALALIGIITVIDCLRQLSYGLMNDFGCFLIDAVLDLAIPVACCFVAKYKPNRILCWILAAIELMSVIQHIPSLYGHLEIWGWALTARFGLALQFFLLPLLSFVVLVIADVLCILAMLSLVKEKKQ